MDGRQDLRVRVDAVEGRILPGQMDVYALPLSLSQCQLERRSQPSQPILIKNIRQDEVAVPIESVFLSWSKGRRRDAALPESIFNPVHRCGF
jgi:hypothetical protein